MRWETLFAVLLVGACSSTGAISEDEVILSGSLRWDPDTEQPVDRAFVRVTDANKMRRCFVTACDGTFQVRRRDFSRMMMPLTSISVERVDRPEASTAEATSIVMRSMTSRIGRETSCNGCHARGLALFPSASAVPALARALSPTCEPGAPSTEIVCPEDRIVPEGKDGLEIVRDFDTYAALVHDVLARRCGSMDCHGGADPAFTLRITSDRQASFASVMAEDPNLVMAKARGAGGHAGGPLIFEADPADQCVADWLGVPRATGGPTSSEILTHSSACIRAASMP